MEHNIYKKGTPHDEIEHYDLLILGGGPAGLTAAIYAGRYNLKTLVVAKSFGGTANLAGELENWPGFVGPGMQLMNNFKEQAEKFGAKFYQDEVKEVEKDENGFILHLEGHEIHGKTLIVALGTEHRQLNILFESM
jgi:thioredoxin reductase (NADPH)